MNRWILLFLVLSSVFILTETRRKHEVMKEEEQVKEQKATVLQALHFQSETQREYSVDIDDVDKDKPIVFLLQRPNQRQTDKDMEENPLTVTITSGGEKKECTMNHHFGLCSLPKPGSEKGVLKIECKKTPCQARWKLQQPQTMQIDGNHTLNHLVSVNQQKNHAMINVFCQDPQIRKQLDDKIEMFTNSKYEKVVNEQGEVIYFFDNEQKGEYFISTGDKAIEACTVARIEHAEDTISLSKKGQEIGDFFINQKTNIYQIKNTIEQDLEINMLIHDSLMQKIRNTTKLDILFLGYNGKNSVILSKLGFAIDDEKDFQSISVVFKKPTEKHDRYEIHMTTVADHFLIAKMRFLQTDLHQLQLTEETFFDLKKGQKINYKIIPLEQEQKNIETIYIGLSDNKALSSTKDSCDKKGCQFTVQAHEDVKGSIYIGEDVKKKKATEIVQEQFQKSIGARLREGQERVYLYKMKKDDAIQMLVNSPNVIVYVANKAACTPSELFKCHQKQINYHNPSIYQSREDIELVFLVRALDNANFVLSIVDAHQPFIQLKDTEPFVYLMDTNQEHVVFNFKIHQKQDVSFNLIAPLKELNMLVLNKEGEKYDKKDEQEAQFTNQGSLTFAKDDLKSTSFIIVISKREEYKDKYVHFTLIASTKQTNLILQPSNVHYEKLPVKASKDYMFSIYPNKKLFLNFHVQNQKIPKLGLKVSNAADYKDQTKTVQFTVDKQTDVLSLQTVAQRLCQSSEQSQCQIFARLTNQMSNDVQVTITLIVQNAIIELKDGIWQNYDLNEAASTAHFYFLPKHQNHSTTIFYHSTLVDLQVAYTLWKSDDTSIDVSQWPFPSNFANSKSPVSNLQFKPSQFIHIDVPKLQKCWPNCVVLLSIMPNKKQLDELHKNPTPLFNINHSFKIMASNNLIQVPEKHKMDIILNKEEEKFLLVDLKKYMERQTIVFFTNTIVGSTIIKANVYTENNPRCPTMQQQGADFMFLGIETQLALEDIKKKLEENKMSDDKSPSLCLLAHAYTESKVSIEFVPEAKQLKTLQLDTTTTVKLLSSQVRLFQVHAATEFYLKISRVTGFPYISHKLCDKPEEMQSCLQDFVNSDEKGEQLVNKIMPLTEKPCLNCMFYVKVTAAQVSQISIHAQSKFIQIELKQNTPLTDAVASGYVNKYLITGVPDKELNINIQVISGEIKVQLNDFGSTKVNKQSKGSNNIHIAIPPKQLQNAKTSLTPSLNSFLFSAGFLHLHLTVQSKDSKSPATFTISYSNGDVQTYLQDGLISQFSLAPKKVSKFLYNNPSSNQIYLHLSTSEASTLNNLKVSIYSMQNANDEDQKQELKVQKQDFKKKTVNPTMLMHLPAKSHYEIEVQNDNSKEVPFFIGVNNREIIYLPLDHEFPFRLLNKQYLYLVIPASKAGYLRFTLNKCDSSQPYISYTDNYQDFVAESFQTQEQITDTLIYDNVIKVKKAGSLYFKIRAEDTTQSVLTVKASFNTNKIDLNNAKAGNKGNLQYSFVDSQTAQITYSGVVCDRNCGDFTYSLIQSNNISSIIAQLVCSSVSFDLFGFSQNKQAEVVPIKATTAKDNKLSFNFPVKEDINYVGVKAVNAKSGAIVYYQPLEITTIRGKISRVMQTASEPQNMSWLIGIVIVISIIVSLIAFRRYQKKKNEAYRPLNYDQMQDSVN